METLQDQVDELRVRIDEQRAVNRSRAQQQQDCLIELKTQLNQKIKEADCSQEILEEREDILNLVLGGIEKLFCLSHCIHSPVLQLLGSHNLSILYSYN